MEPNVAEGIEYWTTQPASLDGVLGGYVGSLPRVESLGSRQFLLYLLPELCRVSSPLQALNYTPPTYRTRALDVGAGIGRVTKDVLLHLFDDVVLVEPVAPFIQQALSAAKSSMDDPSLPNASLWKGLSDRSRSVSFLQGTLQTCNPAKPLQGASLLDRFGFCPLPGKESDMDSGFDVIWCQWCLGHLGERDLVDFLRRCGGALRSRERGVIVVKENVCSDEQDGSARSVFDSQDSSLTRSNQRWKEAFKEAGLKLVREKVQLGLAEDLYPVKMYALKW